jgi:hypothetical protein
VVGAFGVVRLSGEELPLFIRHMPKEVNMLQGEMTRRNRRQTKQAIVFIIFQFCGQPFKFHSCVIETRGALILRDSHKPWLMRCIVTRQASGRQRRRSMRVEVLFSCLYNKLSKLPYKEVKLPYKEVQLSLNL